MSNDIRIKDCTENHEKYVLFLSTLSDKKLSAKLSTVYLQSELAEQKKDTASLELLEIWRSQIIEARIYKVENNIADAPDEIELAIADIEKYVVKTEEREEIIIEEEKQLKPLRPKIQTQQDNNQLSLF